MDESKVIELYAKYDNCRQVAAELGVNDETVRRVLIRNGISRTGNRPKRTPKTENRRPSHCNTKYCGALVVMLRSTLDVTTSDVVACTGIPTNAVVNITNRKCPELKKPRCQRISDGVLSEIEDDYLSGVSTYEIGEKFGIKPATISSLMNKRGHYRGKGQGAVRKNNEARHKKAMERFASEFGKSVESNGMRHKVRRKIRIEGGSRDYGITWKAIAKRNGSMRCEICGIECDPHDKRWGSSGPTHPSVDHVVEICKGGTHTWDNVRLVCCACNIGRNAVMAYA